MVPLRTASVPWYKPQSKAALLAKMMKPTNTDRAKARRNEVFTAWDEALTNRWASRDSAV
jgi:antirestriction protein ArdC